MNASAGSLLVPYSLCHECSGCNWWQPQALGEQHTQDAEPAAGGDGEQGAEGGEEEDAGRHGRQDMSVQVLRA